MKEKVNVNQDREYPVDHKNDQLNAKQAFYVMETQSKLNSSNVGIFDSLANGNRGSLPNVGPFHTELNNSKEFDRPLLHETEQKQNSIHTNQRSGSLVKKAHNSHTINPSLKVIKITSKLKVLIPEKDVDETAWSEVDYACLTTRVPSAEPKLKLDDSQVGIITPNVLTDNIRPMSGVNTLIAGCNDQLKLNSDSRPQQMKLATRINVDLINCPKQQQISPTTIDSASCTITNLNSVPSALVRKLNLPLIEFPNLNDNTKPKDHQQVTNPFLARHSIPSHPTPNRFPGENETQGKRTSSENENFCERMAKISKICLPNNPMLTTVGHLCTPTPRPTSIIEEQDRIPVQMTTHISHYVGKRSRNLVALRPIPRFHDISSQNTNTNTKFILPSIFLSNTRALVSKIEDLEIVVNQNNVDIVCITETWLTESIPNSAVDIKDYSLVRKDRKPDKRGGGVCAYIKSNIGFTIIDKLISPEFEALWLYTRPHRLPRGFSCIIIGIIYHPPQEDDALFMEYLISSLDSALFQFPNAAIMLVGDFNRIDYRFLCNHFNLRQTVQDPTRGNAILDLIFTNLSCYYNTPEILPGIGLSDHNSLIIRPLTTAKKHKAEKVLRRTIKLSMKASFGRWLSTINWSFLETLPNCKEKLDAFNSLLLFGIDKFFPVRKYKQHPTDKLWITPDLKILIDQRQQVMSNDPPTFRRLRNKVNKINNTLRSSFFDKKVQNCDSSALWWKSINRLAGRPMNKTVSSMIVSGKEIRGTQLATHINQSFLSITNSMDPLPELEDNETDTTDPNRVKYHISEQDVCKELSNLKRGKASGFSIPSWILKDFAPELSSPIARIFNASIQESSVPDPWKEADVIPVPKANIIKEAEKDLRPISLTAILSKTLEHFDRDRVDYETD